MREGEGGWYRCWLVNIVFNGFCTPLPPPTPNPKIQSETRHLHGSSGPWRMSQHLSPSGQGIVQILHNVLLYSTNSAQCAWCVRMCIFLTMTAVIFGLYLRRCWKFSIFWWMRSRVAHTVDKMQPLLWIRCDRCVWGWDLLVRILDDIEIQGEEMDYMIIAYFGWDET